MTEVRQWLDANSHRLSDLAERLGVAPDMIHLSAVLILGGFTDEQIEEQLRSVRWGGADEAAMIASVVRSLKAVRVAVTDGRWSATADGGSDSGRAGHRVLAHTADFIIEAWAPDPAACITEAMVALVEEFALASGAAVTKVLPVAADAGPPESQLVSLLEDVIYDLDVLSVVPIGFHLFSAEDGGVIGDMEVVPLEGVTVVGPIPKAVTYHGLSMEPDGGGWRCRVLVDV